MMTANSQNDAIANSGKGRDDDNMTRKEAAGSGLPPASGALPKCICNWKNCRAYQKAFREVKHPTFDGVVKIKLLQDHMESEAYKACLDRTLGVTKPPEWKRGSTGGKGTPTCKYIVAKHHFTERHMQKYDQAPKTYSFVKPFTLNGAKKYLFKVNPAETLPGDYEGGKLYMQCPNVPKDVVKHEFHQAMETVKAQAKQKPQSNNKSNVTSSNKKSTISKKGSQDSDDDDTDNKSNESSHHIAMLQRKEAENKLLKDQLEAMKSQLLLLNAMVSKLQETHFDNQSVAGRSRSFRSNKGRGTSKKTAGSNTTASTKSSSTMNRSSKKSNYSQPVNSKSNAKMQPNNRRCSIGVGSIGVPREIDFDDDDHPDMDSQTLPSVWQEGEADWTETQYESDDDEGDDDDEVSDNDDGVSLAEKTAATSQTFKTKYKMTQNDDENSEQDSDEDDEDDYEEEDFETMSLAATTIVSASKSVKTLPREIELDEDEDSSNSHESLEEEAFETRSFASRSSASIIRPGGGGGGRRSSGGSSFVSSSSSHQSSRKNSILPGQRNRQGGRKTYRQTSGERQYDQENRQGSISSVSQGSRSFNQCTQVTDMDVTDPYGEKGSYTGSVNLSTGMPHGRGRLEYERDGRWYEGDWKHGRWTGQGRLSNGDGDLYEGGLQDDHKHGFGRMKFADGRTFEGYYSNGQMVEGKMTYQDGSTYDGQWEDGMRHGTGRCVFMDQSIYEGEFREGEFHGHGKMTWNDGGWYEGEWLNGDMHGKGREIRANGTLRHDGDWVKGQPLRNRKTTQQHAQRPRRAVAPV